MTHGCTVIKEDGEVWGTLRRLLIDHTTKQVIGADVVLTSSGRLVRVPWDHFEFSGNTIVVNRDQSQMQVTIMRASDSGLPDGVSFEELSDNVMAQSSP